MLEVCLCASRAEDLRNRCEHVRAIREENSAEWYRHLWSSLETSGTYVTHSMNFPVGTDMVSCDQEDK